MLRETNVLIIGASISGLASAASLKESGIEYLIIEKEPHAVPTWRNHYDRLHLHTSKKLSGLPYKPFDKSIPLYPSRQQVVDYLNDYQVKFNIIPAFNTKALRVRRQGDYWLTETSNLTYKSRFIIVATGPFGKPRPIDFNGKESFPG